MWLSLVEKKRSRIFTTNKRRKKYAFFVAFFFGLHFPFVASASLEGLVEHLFALAGRRGGLVASNLAEAILFAQLLAVFGGIGQALDGRFLKSGGRSLWTGRYQGPRNMRGDERMRLRVVHYA